MHDRKPRQHRHSHQHRRPPAAPRRLHNNRHQQHQPHLKKDRHAHQQAQRQQRPGQAPSAAALHQQPCPAQRRRPSGQQPAQNRAHPQKMAMCPIMLPTPPVNERGTCFRGIPAAMPSAKRGNGQRQRRMQPQLPSAAAAAARFRPRRPAETSHGQVAAAKFTGRLFHNGRRRPSPRALCRRLLFSSTLFPCASLLP